jgi:hypothetical protein
MGQPVNATVYWDTVNNQGTVDTITVPAGNGATVIRWTCDTTVISGFSITGLDSTVFNPAQSNSNVTNFTTNDSNNNATSYNYTVSATHVSGLTSRHDPKIENGG